MISIKNISSKQRFQLVLILIIVLSSINLLTFYVSLNSIEETLSSNLTKNLAQSTIKNYITKTFAVVMFSIICIVVALTIFAVNTNKNLKSLNQFIARLGKGELPEIIELEPGLEFNEISKNLNRLVELQKRKIDFLENLGTSPSGKQSKFLEKDKLGIEISALSKRIENIFLINQQRYEEDKKRNWNSEGITSFAEILRSERKDVKELSFRVIQKLVTYLKIQMGSILLLTEKDESFVLQTMASYAYDRRKHLQIEFKIGEGLPGTCALEKEKIYINDIPEEYSDVISGVGQLKPKYLLLVPLKIEDDIFGVLELASFKAFEDFELDFIDQLAESIASSLAAVKANEKTAILLKQSQEQAEKLIQQEDKMLANLKELELTQQKSAIKESETGKILDVLYNHSLTCEFDLNGRINKVSPKLLEHLNLQEEQIIGKHHSDIAQVDKYSDEYKEHWARLKDGKFQARKDTFLKSDGLELSLSANFYPILNEEQKPIKALCSFTDRSELTQLEHTLKDQNFQIKRKNLEMEGLNEAVNASIIKCEIDRDGVILNINDNFATISGYKRKEMLGRKYKLFLQEKEKDHFEIIWKELMKEKTYSGAIRRTKPTGEEIWLMASFSPVLEDDGGIYKVYFLALDITEQKLKYQLLEDANNEIDKLRKLLNNS